MAQVPFGLVPIRDSVRLARAVKENGHQVFVLSNMHVASIERLEKEYAFLDMFDGKVISCRVHMVKPDREIYEHLLKQFGLAEGKTVFIDDTALNVEAASVLGITGIRFESPGQCRDALKEIGCI